MWVFMGERVIDYVINLNAHRNLSAVGHPTTEGVAYIPATCTKMEIDESQLSENRIKNRWRFEFELEFVQSLGNPHYLQSLAQQNLMEDPSFILYLEYLTYWSRPEYARFIMCVNLLS